jgi:serine protease Do
MNRIRKSVAGLLITGGAVGAWFGGQTLLRDAAFAQQQQQVESTREQLKGVEDMASVFRNVGKTVEPSVVSINVRKSIKVGGGGGARGGLPDDMLRRFFRDRNNNNNNGARPDDGNNNDDNNADNGDGTPDPGFEQVGTGSGVIMEVDGRTAYILTNNHVAGGASEMLVTLADGRKIENAKLVGADPKSDLAVVKIEADRLIPARWGDSSTLQKGDWILAFGSPFGYVGSMTHGIVSALDRTNIGILGQYGYEDFIQVDAPINPGNSGGPLVNLHGDVVGVNTAIASQSGGWQGIGFAIPVNEAKFVYQELKSHGKVTRGWLGVSIIDVSKDPQTASVLGFKGNDGVLVEEIIAGTPAYGKLKHGDVITAIADKPVHSTLQLRNMIAATAPGHDVNMTVFREGKEEHVSVKVAEQPEDLTVATNRRGGPGRSGGPGASANIDALGMRLATPNDDLAQRFGLGETREGALVTNVRPNSAAFKAGIRPGDLITEVDRQAVTDAKQATDLLKSRNGKPVLLYVQTPSGGRYVTLQSDKTPAAPQQP